MRKEVVFGLLLALLFWLTVFGVGFTIRKVWFEHQQSSHLIEHEINKYQKLQQDILGNNTSRYVQVDLLKYAEFMFRYWNLRSDEIRSLSSMESTKWLVEHRIQP
jgi:hypothetical protein